MCFIQFHFLLMARKRICAHCPTVTFVAVGATSLILAVVMLTIFSASAESSNFNGVNQQTLLWGNFFVFLTIGAFASAFILGMQHYTKAFLKEHVIGKERGNEEEEEEEKHRKHSPCCECTSSKESCYGLCKGGRWCRCFGADCGSAACCRRCCYFCPAWQWIAGAGALFALLAVTMVITAAVLLSEQMGLSELAQVVGIISLVFLLFGISIFLCLLDQCSLQSWQSPDEAAYSQLDQMDDAGKTVIRKINAKMLDLASH
jgi:hypothetical protein